MVHSLAKYNSEDNLLEDIKLLVAEQMKPRNFLIAYLKLENLQKYSIDIYIKIARQIG